MSALPTGSPYQGYLYSYPHKTAYRDIEPVSVAEVWADEPLDALFLYIHVPFCGMRCGFCNLFTTSRPGDDLVERYLAALDRQVDQLSEALPATSFARMAVGGGTPSWLSASQLDRLFGAAVRMGADLPDLPLSVEVSPKTVTDDRLAVMAEYGTTRVSMGVQSFVGSEVKGLLRPQNDQAVLDAVSRIRSRSFPILNLDLIYGIAGQTEASWDLSVDRALELEPEEIFLYPLYVRPLTGLGRKEQSPDDDLRLDLYRRGRDRLLNAGYTQLSMRMFRRDDAPVVTGPAYRCQQDGMIGLGCGARSYTSRLHYASDYAVQPRVVRSIIEDWVQTEDFATIRRGFWLDDHERRRRTAILSLLTREEGLDLARWRDRFGTEVLADLPEIRDLVEAELAEDRDGTLVLTDAGLERSDAIGPWLISRPVRERMAAWVPR